MLKSFARDLKEFFGKFREVLASNKRELIKVSGMVVLLEIASAVLIMIILWAGGFFVSGGMAADMALLSLFVYGGVTLLIAWVSNAGVSALITDGIVPLLFGRQSDLGRHFWPSLVYFLVESLVATVIGGIVFGLLLLVIFGFAMLHAPPGVLVLLFYIAIPITSLVVSPLANYILAGIGEVILDNRSPFNVLFSRLSSLLTLRANVPIQLVRILLFQIVMLLISSAAASILYVMLLILMFIPIIGWLAILILYLVVHIILRMAYIGGVVYLDRRLSQ